MKIYLSPTTNECISQTAKVVFNEWSKSKKKCFVFAEDKITLSLELEIAKLCGGGFWDIDVMTFNRYVNLKKDAKNVLSKESSVMTIRKIIAENQKQLSCLSASAQKPNLALTLYELISQLESSKVGYEDLNELIKDETTSLKGAFLLKVKDIAFVYQKYQEYLKNSNSYDGNSYLSLMPTLIKEDESLKNSIVIISGFSSLTKQRYEIFDELHKNALDMHAFITYDENSSFYTGEVLDKLLNIDIGAEVIPCDKKLNGEVEVIKNNLYNPSVFKDDFKAYKTDKVSLYEAFNPAEEVENVARDILREITQNKLRFKDISVILGDLNAYLPYVTKYFNDYNVKYFIDNDTTLKEHPITLLILDYINLFRKGLYKDDFIKFVSNGLFCTDKELTDGLISYVLKYSLSRNSLKTPFAYDDENLEEYEKLRQRVLNCYSLLENATTVGGYVNAVYEMLRITNAKGNAVVLGEKLKEIGENSIWDFNDKAYDKMVEVLGEIEKVIGDVKMTLLDFKNVILSGAVATVIGKIPLYNDAVYIGDCQSVKIKNAKILYAVGLNGDIPFAKSDTALLTDGDIDKLSSLKKTIEPKIEVVNKRQKEDVCLALMSFSDKLKLSYSDISPSGSSATKAEVVNYLSTIFNLKPQRKLFDDALSTIKDEGYEARLQTKYLAKKPALRAVAESAESACCGDATSKIEVESFKDAIKNIEDERFIKKAGALINAEGKEKAISKNPIEVFNNGFISTSMLESYFSCPYKNFAQNILRLKESETGDMRANETGNALHELTENYVLRINEVKDKESSDLLVEEITQNILEREEYSRYLNNPMYLYNFAQLKKEGKRVCFAIYNSLLKSKFKPFGVEVEFDENAKYKPIVLNTKNGKFKIRGKVDRIDKFENKIRIIDYKTGNIYADDEHFYTGNKLQLYLYMNAFVDENIKPAGAYYFPVHDGYDKNLDRTYMMKGNTVNDSEIITATDTTLTSGSKSDVVPISLKKDGDVDKNSKIISQETMDSYLKYAVKISEKGVEEISSGYIETTPYDGACKYCSYNGLCGYTNEVCDKTRKVNGVNSTTIEKAIETGDEND